ncbi:uracil-DNA glycosylase [Pseudosulfitobacter sp. DSM 107133]|uniref:uracil-DNA glycosylase n=1 Tax=Pseudosulfitobacter sp. DSM 107133 TaxID=2883100 RepID=UPI000DF2FB97|nr:uracil-DNA glycosylase [Pseudosulfitobacter sp. DSM 107133]UOA28247.1 hypothetical protein DSM107133_02992 [Pseudosulfitobacter sp. DSM 107133]
MNQVAKFVDELASMDMPNIFNPYVDVCEEHDLPDADRLRRKNLTNVLNAALDLNVRTIWIARDLGYRGGRRTGLALTDEAHLDHHARLLGGVDIERATRGPAIAERTATVIWRMLARVREPVFLWNVFPFHPHEPQEPMTNRCHTRSEGRATEWVLHTLIDILEPENVYTIGGDARRGLDKMGIETMSFRHPSYGGQTQFISEVEAAYGLSQPAHEPAAPMQLSLYDHLHTL